MIMKVNFDTVFSQIVSGFDEKKSLLLHTCCAPCASAVLERVTRYFNVTLYFFNPNIDTIQEYEKRASELKKLQARFDIDDIIIAPYEQEEFLESVAGLSDEKEGGARCRECYFLRLKKTSRYAQEKGFDFFTTTLSISPHKDAEMINTIGHEVSAGANFLYADFKKQDGYKRSIELSKELGLYRQNYCGCRFTKPLF